MKFIRLHNDNHKNFMTPGEKYRKVLMASKKKIYKAEDLLGFGRNTIKNAIKDDREMSEDYHKKFIEYFLQNPEWWETEKGDIIIKKHTSVQTGTDSKEKYMDPRETFYRDLIEGNDDYSLIPKTILTDYKIVPEKVLNVITESKDQLNKELQAKHEIIIIGYENKIARLEEEKLALLQQNEQLKRQIPGQHQ